MTRYFWGKAIPDSLEEMVEPARTAVIAVDLQHDFCHKDGYSGSYSDVSFMASILEPNRRLLAAAREAAMLVTYTKQNRRFDGSTDTAVFLAKYMERGIEPRWCEEGSWGAEICEEVRPQKQDVVVIKHHNSGFDGTNLNMILRDKGIKNIVVSGLALSGCVEATVRDAITLGYFVVLTRDCVANGSAELTQQGLQTFERMLLKGNVTTSEALLQVWAGRRGGMTPEQGAAQRATG